MALNDKQVDKYYDYEISDVTLDRTNDTGEIDLSNLNEFTGVQEGVAPHDIMNNYDVGEKERLHGMTGGNGATWDPIYVHDGNIKPNAESGRGTAWTLEGEANTVAYTIAPYGGASVITKEFVRTDIEGERATGYETKYSHRDTSLPIITLTVDPNS